MVVVSSDQLKLGYINLQCFLGKLIILKKRINNWRGMGRKEWAEIHL